MSTGWACGEWRGNSGHIFQEPRDQDPVSATTAGSSVWFRPGTRAVLEGAGGARSITPAPPPSLHSPTSMGCCTSNPRSPSCPVPPGAVSSPAGIAATDKVRGRVGTGGSVKAGDPKARAAALVFSGAVTSRLGTITQALEFTDTKPANTCLVKETVTHKLRVVYPAHRSTQVCRTTGPHDYTQVSREHRPGGENSGTCMACPQNSHETKQNAIALKYAFPAQSSELLSCYQTNTADDHRPP